MQYTALPTPPAGHVSDHRLYDTIMRHIDLDLVTWNYTAFKMSLLAMPAKEQSAAVSAKQASLMKYRKHLVQLEQSLASHEHRGARDMMQAGGDMDALAQMEKDILNL